MIGGAANGPFGFSYSASESRYSASTGGGVSGVDVQPQSAKHSAVNPVNPNLFFISTFSKFHFVLSNASSHMEVLQYHQNVVHSSAW